MKKKRTTSKSRHCLWWFEQFMPSITFHNKSINEKKDQKSNKIYCRYAINLFRFKEILMIKFREISLILIFVQFSICKLENISKNRGNPRFSNVNSSVDAKISVGKDQINAHKIRQFQMKTFQLAFSIILLILTLMTVGGLVGVIIHFITKRQQLIGND